MDTKSNVTEQYNKFRSELLDVFRRAQPVLDRVNAKLGENVKLPIEKLQKEEKFTLTLLGAFQSGKSTLFSYLCGGWELSKVGAGLRTTGCCVTATALPEGTHNYAEVTWLDQTDIKEAIRAYALIDLDNIRLDDLGWCRKLERDILARKSSKKDGCADEMKEVELILLLLHFFDKYKGKCKKNIKEKLDDVEKASPIACYPRGEQWRQTWNEIKSIEDIDRFFKPGDVAFAFCKRIDYYIDSESLRQLGCTIQDCPGMFASNRDTELAEDIVQNSTAVLCTLQGDKGLMADEKDCLNKCARNAKDKIIFGANLHTTVWNWEQTLEKEVTAELANMGFSQPKIAYYHAPLALRCSELYRLLSPIDKLPVASLNAIKRNIEKSEDGNASPEDYLKDKIDDWIRALRKKKKDCFENYTDGKEIKWRELCELHNVPSLIKHVRDILSQRGRKLSLDECMTPVCNDVEDLYNRIGEKIKALNDGRQKTSEEIQDLKRKVQEFRDKKKKLDENIQNNVQYALKIIMNYRLEALKKEIAQQEENIKCKIEESMYGSANWGGKEELRNTFIDCLKGEIRDMLFDIRDKRLAKVFPSLFKDIEKQIVAYARRMNESVGEAFGDVKMRCPNFEGYGQHDIGASPVPPFSKIDSIFKKHEKSGWRQALDYLTFGITSESGVRERVENIWHDIREIISSTMAVTLESMLNADDGPIRAIEKFVAQVKEGGEKVCDRYEQDNIKDLERKQLSASEIRSEIDEYAKLRVQLGDFQKKFGEIRSKVEAIF